MSFLYLPPLLTIEFAADTLIFRSAAEFWGIVAYNSHATNAMVVDIYDGQSSGGTRKLSFTIAATTELRFTAPNPVYCPAGLYVDITGGTPLIFIIWRKF